MEISGDQIAGKIRRHKRQLCLLITKIELPVSSP